MNQIYTGRFYLSAIVFNHWRFFYQNFELQGSLRKFRTFQIVAHKLKLKVAQRSKFDRFH
jgi:hypothetical protein